MAPARLRGLGGARPVIKHAGRPENAEGGGHYSYSLQHAAASTVSMALARLRQLCYSESTRALLTFVAR